MPYKTSNISVSLPEAAIIAAERIAVAEKCSLSRAIAILIFKGAELSMKYLGPYRKREIIPSIAYHADFERQRQPPPESVGDFIARMHLFSETALQVFLMLDPDFKEPTPLYHFPDGTALSHKDRNLLYEGAVLNGYIKGPKPFNG
jgi:hypothetical protein